MNTDNLPKPLQALLTISSITTAKIALTKMVNSFTPSKDSQIGGIGFLPMGESYPKDTDGKPMALLFQLNFAQIATQIDTAQLTYALPKDGILQVYVQACHDCYGLDDFDGSYPNDNYQVRFWQNSDDKMNNAELNDVIAQLKSKTIGALPFDFAYQYSMHFALQTQACNLDTYDYERFSQNIVELQDIDIWEFFDSANIDNGDECLDSYEYLANYNGHHLLGYPDFTQTDPRWYGESAWKDYVSLLQIDTDDENDIMWGDCGIANFFIHPNDLKNHNFAKLIYYWDCC